LETGSLKLDNLLEARTIAAKINNLRVTMELGELREDDMKAPVRTLLSLLAPYVIQSVSTLFWCMFISIKMMFISTYIK